MRKREKETHTQIDDDDDEETKRGHTKCDEIEMFICQMFISIFECVCKDEMMIWN